MATQDYTKTTVKKSENNTPLDLQSYTPDNTPFQYTPGQSVIDIIRQGKQQEKQLANDEDRARKNAKIAALTDFFSALGKVAGGGYAPVQQYQQSPYLTKSLSEVDRLRNMQYQSRYQTRKDYNDAVNLDYNNQLKTHLQNKSAIDRAGADAVNANNRAAIEKYKAGTTTTTQEIEDPRKIEQDNKFKQAQINIQQQRENRLSNKDISTKSSEKEVKTEERNKAIEVVTNAQRNYGRLLSKEAADPLLKTFSQSEKNELAEYKSIPDLMTSGIFRNDNALLATSKRLIKMYKGGQASVASTPVQQNKPIQQTTQQASKQPIQNTDTVAKSKSGTLFEGITATPVQKPIYQIPSKKNKPSLLQ